MPLKYGTEEYNEAVKPYEEIIYGDDIEYQNIEEPGLYSNYMYGNIPDLDEGTSTVSGKGVRTSKDLVSSRSGVSRTSYIGSKLPADDKYWSIGDMPKYTSPTFTAPTRNENRLGALRARAAGAPLRDLRLQTQRAVQSASGLDPTMRRMTLKDALMGYGSGVSKVMSGADRIAQSQYEKEYEDEYKTAMLNYQGATTEAKTNYEAEIKKLYHNIQLGPTSGTHVYDYRQSGGY